MSPSHDIASVLVTHAPENGINSAAGSLKNARSPRVLPKLRVGVLLDGRHIPVWICRTLEQIKGSEHSELALIIENCDKVRMAEPDKLAFLQFWHWVRRLLTKLRVKSGQRTGSSVTEAVKVAAVALSDNCEANHSLIEQIRAANLDVIVHLGSGLPSAQIIGCAKHGVWTFEVKHGDTGLLRPFFCHNYSRRRSTEIILRALNLHSDRIVYRGRFLNDSSWPPRNRRFDRRRRCVVLMRKLSELHAGRLAGLSTTNPEESGRSDAVADLSTKISKAGVLVEWCIDCARKKLFGLWSREQWFIAYRDKLSTDDNRTKQLTILEPPPQHNYADPFVFERNGRHYILFEAWHTKSTGEIWCVEIGEDGNPSEPRMVLSRPYHLSFPFVFQWQGEIYLLPETRQRKTIEVYRASEFPIRWDTPKVLMNDVSAVDTVIAEYRGRLWLFTAGIGGPEFRLNELSLFSADTLFGPWKPHPKNPIVCDIRGARPAGGLFFQGADLMRPAQDCSKAYGQAVTLNRITVLSESDYKEEIVSTILPNWMPNIDRMHTFNQMGKFEVFDARRIISRCHFRSQGRGPGSVRVSHQGKR